MGEVDLAVLHPIYRECVDLNKDHGWDFKFKVDSGDFETMIQFFEGDIPNGPLAFAHPPIAKDWDEMDICNAPDILDFEHKIIIEFEEESRPGKRGGKMGKKGHWADSKRDAARDDHYKRAGFRFCKIWESEYNKGPWNLKLFHFLADCYCKRSCSIYSGMYLKEKELKHALQLRSK